MTKAYYNEIDPFAAQWLRNLINAGLIAPGDVDETDIRDVRPSDLDGYTQHHFFAGIGGWSYALRLAGWPDDRPVVTGSCPCQPFSNAGHLRGVEDERHLWPAFRWILAQRRPSAVFGEQVASSEGYEWLAGVRMDLERLGHEVGIADLPATAIGAKHRRHRNWFCSHAKGLNGRSYGCLVPSREWRSQVTARGLLGLDVSGGWWKADPWAERMPTLVRNFNGLSGTLAGFGNAIVPQLAAEFILASVEAIEDLN